MLIKIMKSFQVMSQLSVAIFMASRTFVVAQKSSKQFQTTSKLENPYKPRCDVSTLRDISRQNVTRGEGVYGFSRFSTFFNIQDLPESPEDFWEL